MSVLRVVIVGAVLAMFHLGIGGEGLVAQVSSPPWSDPMQATNRATNSSTESQRSRMLYANQKKELIAKANKLIELSTTLKQQIDQAGLGTLSADAIKNAGEIEKLAHSVRLGLKQ